MASRPGTSGVTPFESLLKGDGAVDPDTAYARVGPDTIGKILMTSGSTSSPKGVLTTQRMMCVNQTQIADALPFLRERPPRIVDWLPWNHVFGGSHNFNMMLANGGSLYIDDGKPVKGVFARTLENLSMVTGTLAFNVPVGLSMLLGALQKDGDLRQRFFENLDLIFYAGASLPQEVWQGFEQMALQVKGAVPLMTSSWGLTETAPATMMQQEPTASSGIVGVPLTGVTVKLIPDPDMRCEVRVKGPNIMPGYFENPEKTRESFDEEGFFITGDAMKFVDPERPEMGMRFDGPIFRRTLVASAHHSRNGGALPGAEYRRRHLPRRFRTRDGLSPLQERRGRRAGRRERRCLDPVRVDRPAQGKDGRARGPPPDPRFRDQGVQVPPDDAGVLPE